MSTYAPRLYHDTGADRMDCRHFSRKLKICLVFGGILPTEGSALKSSKTNPNLDELIFELKRLSRENEAPVWRTVATKLEKPSRVWAEVNLASIEKHAQAKESVVIAGKLLGAGTLSKPVNVAAYSASESAIKKLENAGGKFMKITELAKLNPKGSGIRIMG
ncbi:MAG: 50S ribosomal protein L18e [Thermoplasmata archaeon]|nr:50S ribosomal protein L18e [Thermoplasmata archaeon]